MEKQFKISQMTSSDLIIDIKSNDKKGALNELLDLISNSTQVTNPTIFKKAIFDRERIMTTGIGYEVAIPHARHKSVKDFVIAIGRKKTGLDFESLDDKPVKLIFMIGASDTQDKDYVRVLSRLFLRLKNPEFMEKMMAAANADEMYNLISITR